MSYALLRIDILPIFSLSNFLFRIEQFFFRIFIDTYFISKVRWQKHQSSGATVVAKEKYHQKMKLTWRKNPSLLNTNLA